MYSTYEQAKQAIAAHSYTEQDFQRDAEESRLFAVFMAEFNGIDAKQVTLWLNAMGQTTQLQGV